MIQYTYWPWIPRPRCAGPSGTRSCAPSTAMMREAERGRNLSARNPTAGPAKRRQEEYMVWHRRLCERTTPAKINLTELGPSTNPPSPNADERTDGLAPTRCFSALGDRDFFEGVLMKYRVGGWREDATVMMTPTGGCPALGGRGCCDLGSCKLRRLSG